MFFVLRILSLLLGIVWRIYWYVMEFPANRNKPKKSNKNIVTEKLAIFIISLFIVIQLFGLVIWPFENQSINIIGFVFVVLGFIECMIARYNLSDNWTNSYEYQIKEKHKLITNGIYKYVRHPIYGGMWLMGIGMLLVAGSYSVVIFTPFVFIGINYLANREEKLLTKHYGKKYLNYMKTSKKFIPFLI